MPKPPEPHDLQWCICCRKVLGSHKGWFGAECQCGKPVGDSLRGAHGAGTRAAGDSGVLLCYPPADA